MVLAHPPFRQVGDAGMDEDRRYRVDHFRRIKIEMDRRRRAEENIGEKFTGSPFAKELRDEIAAASHRAPDQLDFGVTLLKRCPDHLRVANRVGSVDGNLALLFGSLD